MLDVNRKAAAMRCVVRKRQTMFFQQIGLLLSQVQANCIRTAKKVGDDIALSPHPFEIVRSAAFQRAIKERLPEATHINHHSKLALESQITKGRAYAPRNVTIEMRKNQRLFLQRQFRKIIMDGQQHNPLLNAANVSRLRRDRLSDNDFDRRQPIESIRALA